VQQSFCFCFCFSEEKKEGSGKSFIAFYIQVQTRRMKEGGTGGDRQGWEEEENRGIESYMNSSTPADV
jgi:hypothetical protein